jgi:hypothetical protein
MDRFARGYATLQVFSTKPWVETHGYKSVIAPRSEG